MVRVKELTEDELVQELAVDPNLSVLGNTVEYSIMSSLNMTGLDVDRDQKMTKKPAGVITDTKPLSINILGELN